MYTIYIIMPVTTNWDQIVFERNLMKKLRIWRNKTNRLPLILRGARQCGKTTLVCGFGNEYKNFIYLNLENSDDRKLITTSFQETIMAIEFKRGIKINSEETLLFLDEIQACSQAVAHLRFFAEEIPQLSVICAGSLLEIRMSDTTISFPTGRVEYLFLTPFDFSEFLIATDKKNYAGLISDTPTAIPDTIHNLIMEEYHKYLLIGGMPSAIKAYTTTGNILETRNVHTNLYQSIRDDVGRYLNKSEFKYIETVLDGVPYLTGTRITFENFNNSGFKSREIKNALTILEKAFLVFLSYPTTSIALPLTANTRKSPKVFLFDIGIMNSRFGAPMHFDITKTDCGIRGAISEQFVFQELLSSSNIIPDIPLFWTRETNNSNAEVDFCIAHDDLMIPVEVKSGANGKLRSLGMFALLSKQKHCVRLHNAPPSVQQNVTTGSGDIFTLINLPLYYAGRIRDAIVKFL
jgi:uncharacterized protein